MRFEERFRVGQSEQQVWDLFESSAEQVGMCIPGAESVTAVAPDTYRVVITQKVGSVGATFDLKAELRNKQPTAAFEIHAVGRSIKGARGDMRAKAVVRLIGDGTGTDVELDADVALGGMLGSLGHKVIVKKAEEVTADFAVALAALVQGGPMTGDVSG